MPNSSDGRIKELLSLGCFFVETQKRMPFEKYKPPLPHAAVLAPLVERAIEIRVFGGCCTLPLVREERFAKGPRSFMRLDLQEELISGYEEFWYAQGWVRGSVAIVADMGMSELREVFRYCRGPGLMSSLREIRKGTPSIAVTFCKKAAQSSSHLIFSLSASNGLESIDVFANDELLFEAFQVASATCRRLQV